MPTYDKDKLKRLCPALKSARWVLESARANRKEMVREYVGRWYSETGSRRVVPLNLIALYCNIVGRSLVPKNPRFLFSTFNPKQKPVAAACQDWINQKVQDMHLDRTLQRWVFDALFGMGILKVGLATPADAEMAGWNLKAGEPFCENIDLDDWVHDPHCRDLREATFLGHRFRAPLETIKGSKFYGKPRQKLTASYDSPYNSEGDERVSHIGRGDRANWMEYEDMVDLWEIYLPRERLILTLASDDGGTPNYLDEPVGVQEWIGPDAGPYHFLGFMPVPGNPMPRGPIQDLYDLHLLVNRTYRKLMDQAGRQKEILGVIAGGDSTGKAILEASDGDVIKIDSPEKAKVFTFGGPNQANTLFMEQAWQLFSKHGGNLEMAGGLAPQSKTATQDKMLNQNASGQMASMQQDTIDGVQSVGQALGWYHWNHPKQVMQAPWHPDGLPEFATNRKVYPAGATNRFGQPHALRRDAPWSAMKIRVDAYSLQQQTPEGRVQAMTQFVQTMAPLMQLAQQQGVYLDVREYAKKVAVYLDMPDLEDIFSLQEPPVQEQQPPSEGPSLATETTRNYVRRSLGGDSEQATTAERMATLQSGRTNGMPLNPNGASNGRGGS